MTLGGSSKSCYATITACLLVFLAFVPARAFGEHFPSLTLPLPNVSADYLVNFKINGVAAAVGDEVAFFDPRGVMCGRYVVTTYQDYYLLPVYGYDGTANGDLLTVKIWVASANIEVTGSALKLTAGPSLSLNFQPSAIPPQWQEGAGFVLNIDTATHFPQPAGNTLVSYYIGSLTINGHPANIGDEIAVFDQAGVLCGSSRIIEPGAFGSIAVYGDDKTTAWDEGAVEGEVLTFKVWDHVAGIEFGAKDLIFSPGTAAGSFMPSGNPPVWSTKDAGYVLNIDVSVRDRGDIDGNGRVDLADAVRALRALSGLPPAAGDIFKQADVDGDIKIGLAEAIYVLQKLAGLR